MIRKLIRIKKVIKSFVISNKIAAIGILSFISAVLVAIIISYDITEIGNTNENLDNLGFSVKNGKWVYYLGYKENNPDGIYKVKRKEYTKNIR